MCSFSLQMIAIELRYCHYSFTDKDKQMRQKRVEITILVALENIIKGKTKKGILHDSSGTSNEYSIKMYKNEILAH